MRIIKHKNLKELIKIIQSMKMEFNKLIESCKKRQNKMYFKI